MKKNDRNTAMQEITVYGRIGLYEFDFDIEINKAKWDNAVQGLIDEYIENIDEDEIDEGDVVDGKVVKMPGLSIPMSDVLRVCGGLEALRTKMLEQFEEDGMADCKECVMLKEAEDMESLIEDSSELTIFDRYPDALIDAVKMCYKQLYDEQF